MRVRARLALPVLGLATLLAASVSADAAPVCTGTAEDGYVCVDSGAAPGVTTGPGSWVGRCVLVPGESSCRNVGATVPGVTPTLGRPAGIVYCTGPCGSSAVTRVNEAAEPWVEYTENVLENVDEIAEDVEDEHNWCLSGTSVNALVSYANCMVG